MMLARHLTEAKLAPCRKAPRDDHGAVPGLVLQCWVLQCRKNGAPEEMKLDIAICFFSY